MSGYAVRRYQTLDALGLLGDAAKADKSRAGCVDARCLELVRDINLRARDACSFTTSSCSGRIVIVKEPTIGDIGCADEDDNDADDHFGEAKAGNRKLMSEWLLIQHSRVDPADAVAVVHEYIGNMRTNASTGVRTEGNGNGVHAALAYEGVLLLRFEPFLLHCECVSLEAALSLVETARDAGLRNSGVTSGKRNGRHIAAIRCNTRLEVPLVIDNHGEGDANLYGGNLERAVTALIDIANRKLDQTHERLDRFHSLVLRRHCDPTRAAGESAGSPVPAASPREERVRARQMKVLRRIDELQQRAAVVMDARVTPPTPAQSGADEEEGSLHRRWSWGLKVQKKAAGRVRPILRKWKCTELSLLPSAEHDRDSQGAHHDVLTLPLNEEGLRRLIQLRNRCCSSSPACPPGSGDVCENDGRGNPDDDDLLIRECLHFFATTLVRRQFNQNQRQKSNPQRILKQAVKGVLATYYDIKAPGSSKSREYMAMIDLEADRFVKKGYELLGRDVAVVSETFVASPPWNEIFSETDEDGAHLAAVRHLRTTILQGVAAAVGVSRVAMRRAIQRNEMRESATELLHDPDGLGGVCTCVENGIVYRFDLTKVMFASGNGTERMRMPRRIRELSSTASAAVVVDMFAGIGYFSVPILAQSTTSEVAKLIACEWNPASFEALKENMHLNGIDVDRYDLRFGDSSVVAPRNAADHVLLGLIPSSSSGWPAAVRALKDGGGWLHVHGLAKEGDEAAYASSVKDSVAVLAASERGPQWVVEVGRCVRVKGYAPRLLHVVVDLHCRPLAAGPPDAGLESGAGAVPPVVDSHMPRREGAQRVETASARGGALLARTIAGGGRPLVLEDVDMNGADTRWTAEYLMTKCQGTTVCAHVTTADRMSRVSGKNFEFRRMPFRELCARASKHISWSKERAYLAQGEKLYLRSVGHDPRKEVSEFPRLFPDLAAELPLPLHLIPEGSYFSSVLRVSSAQLHLWPHYDVMDNVLMQITGTKRVVLYPPTEAESLCLHGSSSCVVDVDTDAPAPASCPLHEPGSFNPARGKTFECILRPGDTLFIPALWVHAVSSLEFCVSVNVFFRNAALARMDEYNANDVYGNSELNSFQRSTQLVHQAFRKLEEARLPEPYGEFYRKRLRSYIEESFAKRDENLNQMVAAGETF